MCSWCWGFQGILTRIEEQIVEGARLQLVMGGLAPDSDAPMDETTKRFVQEAWHSVAERTGAAFNFDFWKRCRPRRSTWAACRAVLVAEKLASQGREMFGAIQRAYYLEARNPSESDTLMALAGELGIEQRSFAAGLEGPAAQARLEQDFALRDRLGTQGYPSLALEAGGPVEVLMRGYVGLDQLTPILLSRGVISPTRSEG